MSLPPLIREANTDNASWQRTVRDLLNLVARRTVDSGATSERPKNPAVATQYYDTSLGKPIWFHPTGVWKDASGAAV